MELYNTLTQKKEPFVPHTPGQVKMYTCGPTVYHYAHIGNLRTYIMEDVLEKIPPVRWQPGGPGDEHHRRGAPVQRRGYRRG